MEKTTPFEDSGTCHPGCVTRERAIMTILGVRRLLYLGIVLAGGVGLAAWGIAYWLPLESGESGVQTIVPPVGVKAAAIPNPINLARFESRQLQRPVIDVPLVTTVVTAPPPPMPMVQLPPNLQLTGVLVGSVPGTGTAFLRVGQGAAEVVRVGEAMKGLPEVVVTAMTRESVTVRYQGQLFMLVLATAANPVFRRVE